MLPNFFNFPVINYQHFYYGFPSEPMISQFTYRQPQFNVIETQNSPNIQETGSEKDLKLSLTKQDLQEQGIGKPKKHWSQDQDRILKQQVGMYNFDWNQISKKLPGRNQKMCYSRYRRLQNEVKAYWTTKQNQDIKRYFQTQKMSWKAISKFFTNRTAKQIREHYMNFLRPNIKKDQWVIDQDLKIVRMYNQYGKKWKMFEQFFQGRTENQIKNRFYGRLRRLQIKKMVITEDCQ